MPNEPIKHFVFVDLENVPNIDLSLIEGKPVHVTILIGKNQRKLELALVRQIVRLAGQVGLVEVGASGHNALDLTLAVYLGRAAQRSPWSQFHIVSRDKDFDPMIGHLEREGIKVTRCDALAALPLLALAKRATVAPPPSAKSAAPNRKPTDDRLAKLIENIKARPQHRPKNRATLLRHIATFFGNKLSEAGVDEIVAKLEKRRVITIDDEEKVSYGAGE